jgi:formylglycine-generating enzyme required for sulfatase activity
MDSLSATFPLTPSQAQAVQEAYAQTKQIPMAFALQLNSDVTMHFLLIPPGEFMMGLQPDAYARYMLWQPDQDKWPENFLLPHLVQVAAPFYLGRTAVTQAQWQAVRGPTQPISPATTSSPWKTSVPKKPTTIARLCLS